MKTSFISELFARLAAPSPAFFKKLQAIGVSLVILGTGMLGMTGVPDKLREIAGYLVMAGGVIKLIASLPVCNPEDLAPPAVGPENNLPDYRNAPPAPPAKMVSLFKNPVSSPAA